MNNKNTGQPLPTKQEIRQQVAAELCRLRPADRDTASLYVCLQILGTAEWQQAHRVLLYSALPDEVDLSLLLQDAYGCGKEVILPVVDGDTLRLRLYDPAHMAVQGPYKILEPTGQCKEITDCTSIDFAIIPGRAFSRSGQRLGRGKGYYDRILPQLKCPRWGAAFACQMKRFIPTDPWDVKLEKVIES